MVQKQKLVKFFETKENKTQHTKILANQIQGFIPEYKSSSV